MDAVMLARQRMLDRQVEHMELVCRAGAEADARRKAKNNEKAKRAWGKKSPEERRELSRQKKVRMKELHGEDYYVRQNRAWRTTRSGKESTRNYNRSEGHLASAREYRRRKMEEDREGMLARDRERAAEYRRRKRAWALWVLVEWIGNIFGQDPLHDV